MKTEVIRFYENRDDVTLTTYILENSEELHPGRKRPAVLICPGGAYLSCSDREAEPIAMEFLRMGYHAFVLRYSVYGEGKPYWADGSPMEPKPQCQHPMPMREIGLAMSMIKEHEAEWMVDKDKVAICGFSAGAHNCAMYATNWFKPVITDYYGKDKELFRPAACILGYCLSDYVFMKENTDANSGEAAFFQASNTSFLGVPVAADEVYTEVSPARNVSDQTPPMYLWATAGDNLVPVQHTLRMAHALADHKIPFEVHVFQDGDHGLATAGQTAAMAKSQVMPDVAQWTALCEQWLLKRFAYGLPELTPFEEAMKNGKSPFGG